MVGPLLFVSAVFLWCHPIMTTQWLDGIIFSMVRVNKNTRQRIKYEPCMHSSSAYKSSHICFDASIGWHHIPPRPNSLFWTWPFFNWVMVGNFIKNSWLKKSDFLSKSWLKVGMIGPNNTYFQNIKRKGTGNTTFWS